MTTTPAPAVRSVSEDDDHRVIEVRAVPFGGPFNGRDSYGTFFSARSDLGLNDLPIKVWYNHGLDPDFKYSTIGQTIPDTMRTAEDGVWVQLQLDKRHRYYESRVRPLLDHPDGPQVGVSAGSAEHSYRDDKRTGELLDYPVHEISLTPVEANPWAYVAVRSADDDFITIVQAIRKQMDEVGGKEVDRDKLAEDDFAGPDKSYPITDAASVTAAADLIGKADDPEAVKAAIIRIAKRKGLEDALPKAWAEPAAKSADPSLTREDLVGAIPAMRVGARNNASDAERLQGIHDAAHTIHDHSVQNGAACSSGSGQPEPDADDAARSSDASGQPATVRIAVRSSAPTLEDVQARLLEAAREEGQRAARRLIG